VATLLGVAYAASVGGLGSLVGSPPNAVVVAALDAELGLRVTFVEWAALGLPLVAVTLPVVWFVLVRLHPPSPASGTGAGSAGSAAGGGDDPPAAVPAPPPLTPGGRRAAAVFAAVAGLWLLGGFGFLAEGALPDPVYVTLFGGAGPSLVGPGPHQGVLYFAVVAVLAVPALVLLGVSDADDVAGIDWNTLLLFGGGLSLADALGDTGATAWLAGSVFDALAGVPLLLLLFAVVVLTVLLSELASNTATVAVLAPVLVAIGVARGGAYGLAPEVAGATLAVAGAVAASYGFALPVATPPNAVVYGTGAVTRNQMLRAGLLLDLLMAVVTTLLLYGLFAAGLTFVG
jgi:sodium-dependent dicarboxylate transporter 2/3/5